MKLLFLTPTSDIQNYLPNLPFVWASLCGIERCKGFSRCFLYFSIVVVVAVLFCGGGGGGGVLLISASLSVTCYVYWLLPLLFSPNPFHKLAFSPCFFFLPLSLLVFLFVFLFVLFSLHWRYVIKKVLKIRLL